ncbi:hypothetical protein ACFRMQ_09615 [Kitasatospora sp. NPDC056783]|uniref:hypothetical protein n=1 Tax=Kitasatospora sp. NPDC056783 TaxID=3345943 RepID=UPI00367B720A
MKKLRAVVTASVTAALGMTAVMFTAPTAWAWVTEAECTTYVVNQAGSAGNFEATCKATPSTHRALPTVFCEDISGNSYTVIGEWQWLSNTDITYFRVDCKGTDRATGGNLEIR